MIYIYIYRKFDLHQYDVFYAFGSNFMKDESKFSFILSKASAKIAQVFTKSTTFYFMP